MEILRTILFLFSFIFGAYCEDDEVIYKLMFTGDVVDCDNFKNEMLDCGNMKIYTGKNDDGEDVALLGGSFETIGSITADHNIDIEISKYTGLGEEMMWTTSMNLCSSLDDPDTPWYPILQLLKITECPVPKKVYEVPEMKVSLDCVKDVLSHDFVADYRVNLVFSNKADKDSCHSVDIAIFEEEAESEESDE